MDLGSASGSRCCAIADGTAKPVNDGTALPNVSPRRRLTGLFRIGGKIRPSIQATRVPENLGVFRNETLVPLRNVFTETIEVSRYR